MQHVPHMQEKNLSAWTFACLRKQTVSTWLIPTPPLRVDSTLSRLTTLTLLARWFKLPRPSLRPPVAHLKIVGPFTIKFHQQSPALFLLTSPLMEHFLRKTLFYNFISWLLILTLRDCLYRLFTSTSECNADSGTPSNTIFMAYGSGICMPSYSGSNMEADSFNGKFNKQLFVLLLKWFTFIHINRLCEQPIASELLLRIAWQHLQ